PQRGFRRLEGQAAIIKVGSHALLHHGAAYACQNQQGHHQRQYQCQEQYRATLRARGRRPRDPDDHSLFLNAITCVRLRVINSPSTPPARLSTASSSSAICTAVTLFQFAGSAVVHALFSRYVSCRSLTSGTISSGSPISGAVPGYRNCRRYRDVPPSAFAATYHCKARKPP